MSVACCERETDGSDFIRLRAAVSTSPHCATLPCTLWAPEGVRQIPQPRRVAGLLAGMQISPVGSWSPMSTYPFKRIRKTPDLTYFIPLVLELSWMPCVPPLPSSNQSLPAI